MNATLISALWITLFGMALVTIALLALWGLMSFLVKATAKMAASEIAEPDSLAEQDTSALEEFPVASHTSLKKKAAALAVVVALEMQKRTNGHPVSLPAVEPFSAWQSVMRSNRLTQKSRTYARKQ